jgi:mRNA-degrading endonuclease HigB of HigAB toxin-antitoxin module
MYSIIKAESVEPIREWAIEFLSTLGEEINPDYFLEQWQKFFANGIGIIFYLAYDSNVVGGIGALSVPSLLTGKKELIEVFWYVTPQHRKHGLSLYSAMSKYFESADDIKRFAMIHMEKSMPEKLKTFYTKQNFRLLETHWVKDKP